MVSVEPIPLLRDNYAWLLRPSAEVSAAVVDPGEAAPVLEALEEKGLRLQAILVTHHHPDHAGGIRELTDRFPAPVYGGRREPISGLTRPVQEGDRVATPSLGLSVWETPGHTAGSVCYLGGGNVFTGDTLFAGGCGRLFEGTAEEMYHSLARLSRLPGETRVFCAHEYTLSNLAFALRVEPTSPDLLARRAAEEEKRAHGAPTVPSTMEWEWRTNPFLRCHVPSVREAAERFEGRTLSSEAEVFAALRRWKDQG
jgi:hydroxyacylglutathione hydrolase